MPHKKKPQEVGGLRLVAYYRYSGGSHQTEQSIEGQRRDCETYARIHGMVILHEYIDRHISGKTDDRPELQQMIADAGKRMFDYVICCHTGTALSAPGMTASSIKRSSATTAWSCSMPQKPTLKVPAVSL